MPTAIETPPPVSSGRVFYTHDDGQVFTADLLGCWLEEGSGIRGRLRVYSGFPLGGDASIQTSPMVWETPLDAPFARVATKRYWSPWPAVERGT